MCLLLCILNENIAEYGQIKIHLIWAFLKYRPPTVGACLVFHQLGAKTGRIIVSIVCD